MRRNTHLYDISLNKSSSHRLIRQKEASMAEFTMSSACCFNFLLC